MNDLKGQNNEDKSNEFYYSYGMWWSSRIVVKLS